MNVFITGGTGLIGSAVVAELLNHGHDVVGLARSESSAEALRSVGAVPHAGDLGDLEALRSGAAQADGVIHLAFGADFSSADALAKVVAQENAALTTMGAALVGSNRPLVTCSGTPLAAGRLSTEEDPLPLEGPVGGRGRSVNEVIALADRGVRASAVRLPRTVHNHGTGGFAGMLTQIARQTGVSGYAGDGTQRWPAVHALDAAVLFRLALEQAPAGTSWHAVGDEGIGSSTSPPSSVGASSSPSSPCRRRPTAPSDRSSPPTNRRRVCTHEPRWAGGRRTRACSRTSRTCGPDSAAHPRRRPPALGGLRPTGVRRGDPRRRDPQSAVPGASTRAVGVEEGSSGRRGDRTELMRRRVLVVTGEHGLVDRDPEQHADEMLGGSPLVVDGQLLTIGQRRKLSASAARTRSNPCSYQAVAISGKRSADEITSRRSRRTRAASMP